MNIVIGDLRPGDLIIRREWDSTGFHVGSSGEFVLSVVPSSESGNHFDIITLTLWSSFHLLRKQVCVWKHQYRSSDVGADEIIRGYDVDNDD